ncbi:MAG: SLBB domain-containing protein [Treponema phagedenis]|uniref:SLBB domain-containing protein n=1 Tax=Treponema phagedenis TaxID=162 RepID=UPI003133D31A
MIHFKRVISTVCMIAYSFVSAYSQSLDGTAYNKDAQAALLSDQKTTVQKYSGIPGILPPNPQTAMSNPDYVVLPGDIYKLAYTIGGTSVEYPVVVDSAYSIRVSNLGIITVRGKTFAAVKKQVETLVSQNYPLSAVQFVLVSPSTFTVTVKGEVKGTGEVSAWALTRASGVIAPFLTSFSSKRNIVITSEDGKIREYDLFKAVRDGDMTQDPYLRPGDIITVPRAERIVHITGAVERPGAYELLHDDTLGNLITRYGGGFLPRVGVNKKQIKIFRITDSEPAVPETFIADFEKDGAGFELKDNDTVSVEGSLLGHAQIYLEVAGNRAVPFPFVPGDDAVAFVRKNSSLFTVSGVDTGRAFILRGEQRIPFNLNPILFDSAYTAVLLFEAGDKLIVPNIEQTVIVTGAVLKPGTYPYMPGRTFDYYIALAGGFDDQRNTGSSVTIRDVYGKKLDKNAVIGPDTIINAKSNAFMYNFNMYVPLITVTATVVTAVIAVLTFASKK